MFAGAVSWKESRRDLAYFFQIAHRDLLPNIGSVVLMKTLDKAIAFRSVEWRENQFRPHQQGQPRDPANHALMSSASAKAALVIHLRELRDTQGFPQVNQKVKRRIRALVVLLLPIRKT